MRCETFRRLGPARRACIAILWSLPASILAQEPDRPTLPAGADPNAWEAYFELGGKLFTSDPTRAAAALYWASRLDPSRAEPLYGRWASFLMRQREADLVAYLRNDDVAMRRPEVMEADSLRDLALVRNPFVHRGLELLAFQRFPGAIGDDRADRAWVAYSTANFTKAIELWTRSVERDAKNGHWRRFNRALAYVASGDLPGALLDLRTLVEVLRKEDERDLVVMYRSKHYLLYMIGLIHLEMRRYVSAREAFGEALVEDAAFAYGSAGLAAVSRAQRQSAQAATEYAGAVELAPNDGHLRYLYAQVLFELQRFEGAAEQLSRAIELEPFYPAPVHLLGRVRERQGREAEAFAHFERFVSLAPAEDTQAKAMRLRLELRAKRTP